MQSTGQASTQAVSFVPMQGSPITKAIRHLRLSEPTVRPRKEAVQAGGMRVRAVTLGTYRCLAFQTDYSRRHEGVGAVAQSASTPVRPVRQALVEMGSSGYAVRATRRVRRESRGIV